MKYLALYQGGSFHAQSICTATKGLIAKREHSLVYFDTVKMVLDHRSYEPDIAPVLSLSKVSKQAVNT